MEEDFDADEVVWNEVENILKEKIGENCFVVHSAYGYTDNEEIHNNLNEVAAEGNCIFTRKAEFFFGGKEGRDYTSKPILNPTWMDVCIFANESIIETNDYHHIFLEDIIYLKTNALDINIYDLFMGS